jgi:putative endonuclease
MYILECADGTYYTGSTVNLEKRVWEHQNLSGARYTQKKHPVRLVYFEEYSRIDEAFYREKQVQKWSHGKKKALIDKNPADLHQLSECQNESHSKNVDQSLYRGADSIKPCSLNPPDDRRRVP